MDISWNRLGDEGAKCLADALKVNQVRCERGSKMVLSSLMIVSRHSVNLLCDEIMLVTKVQNV